MVGGGGGSFLLSSCVIHFGARQAAWSIAEAQQGDRMPPCLPASLPHHSLPHHSLPCCSLSPSRPCTHLEHANYLGRELQRAEFALATGAAYVQD